MFLQYYHGYNFAFTSTLSWISAVWKNVYRVYEFKYIPSNIYKKDMLTLEDGLDRTKLSFDV